MRGVPAAWGDVAAAGVVTDRAWKAAERRLARDVGTERIPVTGERHGADFAAGMFCYQLKVRRVIPSWLGLWMDGICGTAARTGRVGVLVLKRPGERDEDAVVCVRWRDWVDLHGDR